MRRPLLTLGLLVAMPLSLAAAEIVTVTLVGGAKVTGPLLRENDQGVVIDLGHEVVNLPAKRVLNISREKEETTARDKQTGGIFTTGRLEALDVPELVKRFGDAVVMVKNAGGLGSGFIISREGHIVTNYHVVENQTRVQVTLFRRTSSGYEKHELRRVKILALQPMRDIALLQLDLEEYKGTLPAPVVINDQDDLRGGDLVFAIGNPLGLERSVTQGIVSSTTRKIGHLRLIQTDASINPGNSGGPIFNVRGEVVAIASAGAQMFDGLAFGIPANELIDFLVHRETYLYDPSQPQNGITYLPPPYKPGGESAAKAGDSKKTEPTATSPAKGK